MPEEGPNARNGRRITFRCMAMTVLQETAARRRKPSKSRKVFKILVFSLFTAGFVYQVYKFLSILLEYPTVVNIMISSPETYMRPAFTFCNNERIMRSKYCKKYPTRCSKPSDEFCTKYSDYCGNNVSIVPEETFYKANYDLADVIELSHNFTDIFIEGQKYFKQDPEKVLRMRLFGAEEFSTCFILNSRVDSPFDPPIMAKTKNFSHTAYYYFTLDPKISDAFDPISKDGIFMSIHSPFESINPFEKGIFMKPGRLYKFTITMQEENLLPPPYKTKCLNYTELWLKNNRTGPRSQKSCRTKYVYDAFASSCNCTTPEIEYPNYKNMKLCTGDKLQQCLRSSGVVEEIRNQRKISFVQCREECWYLKYTYAVQDCYIDLSLINSTIKTDISKIYVNVDIDDTEVITFNYRPQYQEVEAFSYIGGFIGIWLGVSLVQITDFLENTFIFLRTCCKRKPKKQIPCDED